jgi:hypothetical protein
MHFVFMINDVLCLYVDHSRQGGVVCRVNACEIDCGCVYVVDRPCGPGHPVDSRHRGHANEPSKEVQMDGGRAQVETADDLIPCDVHPIPWDAHRPWGEPNWRE